MIVSLCAALIAVQCFVFPYDAENEFIRIRIFLITRIGNSISDLAEQIFDIVENDYAILRLAKPGYISVNIKGVMSDELIKRNIEVVRRNV